MADINYALAVLGAIAGVVTILAVVFTLGAAWAGRNCTCRNRLTREDEMDLAENAKPGGYYGQKTAMRLAKRDGRSAQ